MRTITINLYSYEELTEEAKQNAKNNVEFPDFWDYDKAQSAREAMAIYKRIGDIEEVISGARLYTWIQNNIMDGLTTKKYYILAGKRRLSRIFRYTDEANLTGVCFDYDFLAPIMDFLKNPVGDSDSLSRTDVNRIYERLIQDEYNYFYSDEGFSEHCEANGLEFLKDGSTY